MASTLKCGRLVWLAAQIAMIAMPATAGQITVHQDANPVIAIEGRIMPGDERIFHDAAEALPAALVMLSGPGGSLPPALAIGREIRARGWQTLVPAGAFCASACAVIWLAGTTRLLASDARIGFHAVATVHGGEPAVETHAFDPVLVNYLTALGYAFDVTATIVNTPSVLIRWLDRLELNANGIATERYP